MTDVYSKTLSKIYTAIDQDRQDISPYKDAFSMIRNIGDELDTVQVDMAHFLRGKVSDSMKAHKDNYVFRQDLFELYRNVLCYSAPECTDDFILYMEIDRPYEKQFYMPRRKQLRMIADSLDKLASRELEMLGISLPPGVGKTTMAEFFLTRIGGKNPELPILVGSHSNSFLRGMYGEILRMLSPDGEYKWHDIFPNLQVINTNAQDMMIDLGESAKDGKRFMTFEFSSIGSGNAGKVRAANLLYCDDLVDSMETALSRDRLDKLYNTYATDLRQRKIGSCVELHISTRWSLGDVVGRLEAMNADNPRAEFINYPALNENDESNFDYPIPAGLSTKFLHEQRDAMDDASWRALYMGQPIEREGQLYKEDEVRRYFDLPDGEPDAIIGVCDTKSSGADYCVLPVAYQYGQDYYIEDVLCEDYAPNIVDVNLSKILLKHEVQLCQFESNAAGGKTAEKVQNMVRQQGGRTKITTKWTQQNKETKILVASPWVIDHCLFKDNSVIKSDKEYRLFMSMMFGYTLKGKNAHDDVVDALAQLSQYAQGFTTKAEAMRSPFRR